MQTDRAPTTRSSRAPAAALPRLRGVSLLRSMVRLRYSASRCAKVRSPTTAISSWSVAVLCSAGGALAAHLHRLRVNLRGHLCTRNASPSGSATSMSMCARIAAGAGQRLRSARYLRHLATWGWAASRSRHPFSLEPRYPVQTGGKVRSAVHYITPITQHTCPYSVVRAPHHTKMAKNAAAARLRSPLKLPRQLHPPPPTRHPPL